ncbi:hypothetical protein BaRGS_00001566 [Batillaria attramentaria]|uniref:Uncharacterized protein n=1 Tax=Batillaria attramentaria TaxID=370345 RepID=A0ABD0M8E6_9CAEN
MGICVKTCDESAERRAWEQCIVLCFLTDSGKLGVLFKYDIGNAISLGSIAVLIADTTEQLVETDPKDHVVPASAHTHTESTINFLKTMVGKVTTVYTSSAPDRSSI